jgi:diguanylate cyclase (GGDEF)-like protein/PAS domain S-box-containing protein
VAIPDTEEPILTAPYQDLLDAEPPEVTPAVSAAIRRAFPDGILLVDSNQRIVSYNRRFVDIWNIASDLLASKSDTRVVEAVAAQVADREGFKARVKELYARIADTSRDDILLEDGRTLDRYSAPVTLADGSHFGRVWFFRDITEHRRADGRVLEDASQFRALVEQQIAGIFIIRADGVLAYINPLFSALFGYTPAEVIGLPFIELIVDADRTALTRSFSDHQMGGPRAIQTETAIKRKGGGIMNVVAHASLSSYQGKPALVGLLIDVTEEKIARELLRSSEERFRSVFNSVNDAIAVLDIDTQKYIEANPRACEMFGYRRDEMIGLGIESTMTAVRPYAVEDTAPLLQRALAGESFIAEWLCKAKNGRQFWAELSLRRACYGGRNVLFITAQDITERKLAGAAAGYRDHVWHAVTLSVARLVSEPSLAVAVPAILEMAGTALKVDRMAIVKRRSQTSELADASIAYDWGEHPPEKGHEPFDAASQASPVIREWLSPLSSGATVTADVDTATGAIADFMRGKSIRSVLLIPVSVGAKLWGFIGLNMHTAVRHWTSIEIDALRTLADVVGAMFAREESRTLLLDSQARFRAVSDSAQDAIVMIDSAARVMYWNPAAERIFGHTEGEAIGKAVHQWLAPAQYQDRSKAAFDGFAHTGSGNFIGKTVELTAIRKGGVEFPVELSISSLLLGAEWHAVATIRDITERKRIGEQIHFAARHDNLTGLVNRAVFVEALKVAIDRAQRYAEAFAVLYLDLDHFKDVNDTLGHPVGDLLLQALSDRLLGAIRGTDTVARFGGDEFALIQTNIAEPLDAGVLAEKLLTAINLPFVIDGNSIRSGASVGIAVFGDDSPSAESLLSHADVALYRAKAEGRGTYRFFTDAMDVEVRTRVTLAADLRQAMAAGHLYLMYQPQLDADTGRFVGMEALARWQHPTRGPVPPGVFIPIAEQSGLIIALGRWILRQACGQMKTWTDAGIAPPLMSVNVSGLQFKPPLAFEQELAAILEEARLPAHCLELELTESVLVEVSRANNEALVRLRASGHRIAIDDFGTGYSSLEYLCRFPVDRIKLSDNFIVGLTSIATNRVIVRAAIALAQELNLDVVAEGVETAEQLGLLRSWGCRKIQGYYFSQALPAGDLEGPLRAGRFAFPPPDRQPTS